MKRLKIALLAALILCIPFVYSQIHDPVGGGVWLNMTQGSIDATCTGCAIAIKPNSATGVVGTVTNDSANAGAVGEFKTTTVATADAVSLTTATAKDVMTLSLTAGDWDVSSMVQHKPAASTSITVLSCSLSLTADTMNTQPGGSGIGTDPIVTLGQAAQVNALEVSQPLTNVRVLLSATTTVHLVCKDTFTVSTMGAYGTIRARRVR